MIVQKPSFDSTQFLKNLSQRPGVYRMLGSGSQVLYVGKAKNLKARVASYFRSSALDAKTLALVQRILDVEVTITHSETEALLLEQNWIKEFKPPFNIVFRDDKSYPYIAVSRDHAYPRMSFYRGARNQKTTYFGPYPSAYAVRESLNILQKVFRIRQCEDSFYSNRSRPCLQYQIDRCSAPCCGLVSEDDYRQDMELAQMFLEGKSEEVTRIYTERMEQAAKDLAFEDAARCRDQIGHLRRIQEQQTVQGLTQDVDVMAVAIDKQNIAVQVMFVRDGRLLGNRTFFPQSRLDMTPEGVMSTFIPQFYLGSVARDFPVEIILNCRLGDAYLLETVLSEGAGKRVRISDRSRGKRARFARLAGTNAEQSLLAYSAHRQNLMKQYENLREVLSLSELPERLECFDISHSAGEATTASCVVFDHNGPVKSEYRRFNISDITPGDDYAALAQAISRRYKRVKAGEGRLPDVLFIDGGKGQLHVAEDVIEELQMDGVLLVGVAKGPERRPGLETLHISNRQQEVHLPSDLPALHLIQQLRDESHRFAITAHRQRRGRKRKTSVLEGIQGVGPKRRRALLSYFGGIQRISAAPVEDIARVSGISRKLAEHIYDTLH